MLQQHQCTGSAWLLTNEVRNVSDGMLVVRERHFKPQVSTNIPVNTISYTRGNDLSGNLQGAGGWVHGVVEGQAQDLDVELNGIAGEVAFGPAPITVLDDDVPKGVRSNAQFPTEPARRTMGANRTDAARVRVLAGGWVTE